MRVSGRRHAVVHARAARWDWLDAFFRNNNRKNAKAQCLGEKDGGSLVGVFFVCAMACDRRQEPRNGFFSVGCGRYAIAAVGTAGRQHHAQKRGRPPPTAGLEKSAAKKKREYADAFAQLVRVMLFAGQKRIFYFYILKNKKRAKTDCDGAIARTRTRLGRAKTDVRNEFIFLP